MYQHGIDHGRSSSVSDHPDTDEAGPACSSFELISLDTGKTYATATIERN